MEVGREVGVGEPSGQGVLSFAKHAYRQRIRTMRIRVKTKSHDCRKHTSRRLLRYIMDVTCVHRRGNAGPAVSGKHADGC